MCAAGDWQPVCTNSGMLVQKFHLPWAVATVAILSSFPGAATLAAQAQAKDACSLLRPDEVQSLATSTRISDGVSTNDAALGSVICTYRWAADTNPRSARYEFQIVNGDPSRMFPAMTPAQVKEALLRPAKDGRGGASVLSGIGDVALFKTESLQKADVTALIKGRILTLSINSSDAQTRKDQLVALLKIAAGRL